MYIFLYFVKMSALLMMYWQFCKFHLQDHGKFHRKNQITEGICVKFAGSNGLYIKSKHTNKLLRTNNCFSYVPNIYLFQLYMCV